MNEGTNFERGSKEESQLISPSNSQRDLRYVLTQNCNYQCSFCHKEGCDGSEKELLNSDDYDFIFSTAKTTLGIEKVTLSGGEPMIRHDILEISKKLHDSGAKVTMVSNGAIIPKYPEAMKHIDILNLSLHVTDQDLYAALTGSHTNIKELIHEIARVYRWNLHMKIKINSAIINNQNMPNSDDFRYKMELASVYGWKLKYLELSDTTIPGFVDLDTFEKELFKIGFVLTNKTSRHSSYTKNGVEVITGKVFCAQAKETQDPQGFCKENNDIYITPDGYFSSCPMDIKKYNAYDSIVARDVGALSYILQQTIDKKTEYACPFSS